VPGNDLQVIGSGPTVGDKSTFEDAMHVLEKYDLVKSAPYSIISHLKKGIEGNIKENPGPDDPVFENTRNIIIADNNKALNAAMSEAVELGYESHIMTDALEGLAEDSAKEWVEKVLAQKRKNICLLAGGETTVQVKGTGKGGRNQQFALAAAIALKKFFRNYIACCGY
jgi:glycerate-2-kinase